MRVICPHCEKTVTLSDSTAGLPAPCPSCGQTFTTPTLLTAEPVVVPAAAAPTTPAAASPPTIAVAPTPPPAAAAPPTPTQPPVTVSIPGSMQFNLSERVVHWIGPLALVVLFFASFFSWVGSYPDGYPVYTQSAWQAIRGKFTTDITGEKVIGREEALEESRSFSFGTLLALVVLVFATAIAVLDLSREYVSFAVPDVVQTIWPHRLSVLAVAALVIFLILSSQLMSGFGLENAAAAAAEKRTAPPSTAEAAKADANTEAKTMRDLQRGVELGRYSLRRTHWLCLGYLASGIAVVGFALELWLHRRGDRREPSLELRW